MNLTNLSVISLVLMLLWPHDVASQTTDFSKLVVFGDSISDTGNLAFIDLPPPYFENRISNGPVAVDFIAQSINSNADRSNHIFGTASGFNYAVAGGNIVGSDVEDLSQQVTAFLNRSNQQADRDALYVLIIGGNDLRDIRSITDTGLATNRITQVVAQFETQLNRLINAGARAILVANVPNIGRIPETLARRAQDPNIAIRAQQYVQEYNLLLAQLLSEFEDRSDLSLIEFDLFQALENILDNADNLGFSNIEQGCFDADSLSIATECLVFGFDSRVFFDNIHPSRAANQVLAPLIVNAIPALPSQTPLNPNEMPEEAPERAIIIAPIINLLLAPD